MSKKGYTPEQIVKKLREADVMVSKGETVAQVIRKLGNSNAQFNLGVICSNGFGAAQDLSQAFKWFLMAAENSLAEAQYNTGIMYAKGEGPLRIRLRPIVG